MHKRFIFLGFLSRIHEQMIVNMIWRLDGSVPYRIDNVKILRIDRYLWIFDCKENILLPDIYIRMASEMGRAKIVNKLSEPNLLQKISLIYVYGKRLHICAVTTTLHKISRPMCDVRVLLRISTVNTKYLRYYIPNVL